MKQIVFMLATVLVSLSASAHQVSELNGTWQESAGGISATFTIAGLPKDIPVGKIAICHSLASGAGVTINEVCSLQRLSDTEFDSHCYGAGQSDHTRIQIVDRNSFVETDLQTGLGSGLATRQ